MHIDINCDTGEGIGNDAALMPYITSANIACGYHAGDADTMRTTIQLAMDHGVKVGAHPSFDDRENFGRTAMQLSPNEVYHLVYKQLDLFKDIADECGATLHHVKPHGALYNQAARDAEMAGALALAMRDFGSHLFLYGLSGSELLAEAKKAGLRTKSEVFADRSYADDGSLTPRSEPGALIENEAQAVAQVRQMVQQGNVTTRSGALVAVVAETVCVHGDSPHAVALVKALFQAFNSPTL